jgi:dipeptidase
MVVHLRARMPPLLRQVYWASLSNPCCNVFQPLYLHDVRAPQAWARGTSTYSSDSPWWWANRLKLLCDLNYEAVNPAVRVAFDETERWEASRQEEVEAVALRLLESGKGAEAAVVLQGFVDENSRRIEEQYPALQKAAEDALRGRGLRYVFLDYLKSWTANKGVPLPVQ